MQVRKFEAKTIKDAIELVKYHMGPDAIILSAKDNSKNFGLMGESSVEVTAAVSDSKFQKKKVAESKLDSRSKQKYMTATARTQKEYIDKVFTRDRAEQNFRNENSNEDSMTHANANSVTAAVMNERPKKRPLTTARYIDIDEDSDDSQMQSQSIMNSAANAAGLRNVNAMQSTMQQRAVSAQNMMTAKAQAAHVADQARSHASVDIQAAASEKMQIAMLQKEIMTLKGLLEKFQSVPQNFMSLHPGAEDGLPYEFSSLFKKLVDAGVSHSNVVEMLKVANEVLPNEQKKKRAFVEGWAIKFLLDHVQIVEKPFKTKYHVFVGATGQGKTSTVIKMACHLLMKERKKVAILSGDMIKVGAADQLKIYSQIMNVPCAIVTKPNDWSHFEKALSNVDHVLFDTPGVNLKSTQDFELLRNILPPHMNEMSVHYVQSALARDTDAFEIAERFKVVGFNDVIFTRLDEAVQYGLIYNFQKQMNVPVHSFGIGNAIPEDYELATKERVADLIFALSKIKKERG